MALTAGTRLGPYEVLVAIGAGGMGEVYRARDTRLHRDVAIKVLPQSVAQDPERLARFEREARTLASLNHPHIAQVHGVEDAHGSMALVMELVEGPTLADQIAVGPVPLAGALPLARQIVEALEAAHEQGIVHRDLKPANVKVTPDGVVKVLDFGLAKVSDRGIDSPSAASQLPTITTPAMTQTGVILGTAAYMSPEQAKGRSTDRRTDVWAFGCVLYEMLSGRRAFAGEDVADTLAFVLTREPDWTALPANTPTTVLTLLRRCLAKDARNRLPSMVPVRLELEDLSAGVSSGTSNTGAQARPAGSLLRQRVAWALAGMAVTAAAFAMIVPLFRRPVPDATAVLLRSSLLPPEGTAWPAPGPDRLDLSDDGQALAFTATGPAPEGTRVWVRRFDSAVAQAFAGTEGATALAWSPDARSLAFAAGGVLKRLDTRSGQISTISTSVSGGFAWGARDVILLTVTSPDGAVVSAIPAAGGTPKPVTALTKEYSGFAGPRFLSDGNRYVYMAARRDSNTNDTWLGSIDGAIEHKLVLADAADAIVAAGHLLFVRDGRLMAQRFDEGSLAVVGEPSVVVETLATGGASGQAGVFAAADNRTLVYLERAVESQSQLTWVDRGGRTLGTLGPPDDQIAPEIAPDGSRVLVSILDKAKNARDLWIYDVARNLRSRFTFDDADENKGVWSPDARRIVFNRLAQGRFELFSKPTDGSGGESLLLSDDQDKVPVDWSSDGAALLYASLTRLSARTSGDAFELRMPRGGPPAPVAPSSFNEGFPTISPDGRWHMYQSNESGRAEVYVQRRQGTPARVQVSTRGGTWARWRSDGREVYYVASDNALMAVSLDASDESARVGSETRLFDVGTRRVAYRGVSPYPYDVAAGGRRFLLNRQIESTNVTPLSLVQNWPLSLRTPPAP